MAIKSRPTEVRNLGQTAARHVDLVIEIPFRDSWLYVMVLVEAQSTVDWRMPLRILQETALLYGRLLKRPEV